MKNLFSAASASFLTLLSPAVADTIVLKDGTKLDGKVAREDATSYVVEVNVTKSIKDERVIAKTDVARIEREKVDLVAFQKIEKLKTIPDLLTSEEYAQRIRTVEKFLADFRGSSKNKEATEILVKLKAEANEVLAGGIKINGSMVPAGEYRANAYEIDARIQEAKIRALIAEGKYLTALRTFSDFSRDFSNTSAHTALIPMIVQVINAYLADVSQSLASYDARVKEREVGLQRMSSADRNTAENAIREENSGFEALLKQETDSRVGWVTVRPFLKATLEQTINFGKQELARLEALKAAPPADGGKAYREAFALIQNKGDSSAVSTAIANARTAMVAPKYIDSLEAAAKASGILK